MEAFNFYTDIKFRFADFLDILLLLFGTFVAIVAGGMYPLLFVVYGHLGNVLIDYTKLKNFKLSPQSVNNQTRDTEW